MTTENIHTKKIILNGEKVGLIDAARAHLVILSYYVLTRKLIAKPVPLGLPIELGEYTSGLITELKAMGLPVATYAEW